MAEKVVFQQTVLDLHQKWKSQNISSSKVSLLEN